MKVKAYTSDGMCFSWKLPSWVVYFGFVKVSVGQVIFTFPSGFLFGSVMFTFRASFE